MSVSMIYCPKCGSANRRGSRFCNECGEPLPTYTALRCPMCGAMNPVGNVYCDRCQARLVPMTAPSSEEKRYEPPPIKGLSLPTIPLEEREAPSATTEDWLAQLRPPAAPQDVTREEPVAPPGTGREADWLDQLRAASAAQEAEVEEADAWLRQLRESIPQVSPQPEPLAPAELPDWLREVAPPEVPEEAAPAMELPDWLREVAPPEVTREPLKPPIVPPLTEFPPGATTTEVPDWLIELGKVATPGAPAPPGLETGGIVELARAEIPPWLEAMRPRPEAPAREPIETEGLLAGLSGVLGPGLRLEVPAVHKRLPAVEIKEATLARAKLLQRLLTQPIEVPQPEARKRGGGLGARIQGWVVTVVLIVAVVGTLLAPRMLPGISLPVHLDTSPARGVYEIIQGLSTSTTALVALEYGAAEADEMNPVAEPLLRHLLRQGTRFSIVTTQPEGKLIAENLLLSVAAPESMYDVIEYRPTGAAGVSQLLAGVGEKPGVILLLTARPASLRWWIEQTQARGEKLTLVAGLSAALEPAAAPYINAGALRAALYGLSGAAAYESENGLPGQATERLDALVVGHITIIALMLIGAIIYTLTGLPQKRRQ